VRQVFYLVVARGLIEKTVSGYRRVEYVLKNGRQAELIPFEHIRDDSYVALDGAGSRYGYMSPEEYMAEVNEQIRG
jgi:hypothetical protein